MIKAPSCRECQNRLEKVERATLLPFAICLDPNDPLSHGIHQAVMRSIDPALAAKPGMRQSEIERERRARLALRKKVMDRLFIADETMNKYAFPGFGMEHANGSRLAIHGPHDENEIRVIGEKFIRVAVWVMRDNQFIERDTAISTHVVHIENLPEIEALVRGGDALDIFPGIRVTIRTAFDHPRTHLALFELWGRLKLFVSVIPKRDVDAT